MASWVQVRTMTEYGKAEHSKWVNKEPLQRHLEKWEEQAEKTSAESGSLYPSKESGMTMCTCDPSTMGRRNRSITGVFWLPARCQVQWEMLSQGIGEENRTGNLAFFSGLLVRHMHLHAHVHTHHTHTSKKEQLKGNVCHATPQESWRRNGFLEFKTGSVNQEHLNGRALPGILNLHKHWHSKSSLDSEAHRNTPSHSIYIAQMQINGRLGEPKFDPQYCKEKFPRNITKLDMQFTRCLILLFMDE